MRFDYYENEETVNDSDIFVKQNADRSSKRKSEIHKRSRNRQKNPEEAGSNVKNVPEYLNTHGEVPEQAQWDVSTEDVSRFVLRTVTCVECRVVNLSC